MSDLSVPLKRAVDDYLSGAHAARIVLRRALEHYRTGETTFSEASVEIEETALAMIEAADGLSRSIAKMKGTLGSDER